MKLTWLNNHRFNLPEDVSFMVNELDEKQAEIERLRAALEPLACTCDRANGAACRCAEVNCAFWNARAALEGK